MTDEMYNIMMNIWIDLEKDMIFRDAGPERKYRRLDLEKEIGFRLSCYNPGMFWEMLVEINPEKRHFNDYEFPSWSGMKFDLLSINVPEKDVRHICLRLENKEHRDVFVTVCADLARDLRGVSASDERENMLIEFLDKWNRFFERYSLKGLSSERQRGLFGELFWIKRLVEEGLGKAIALKSWKGCLRGYHDFEINGQVVEVKTTLTKEPRKVYINNERQLDDRGLVSLHLIVFSLIQSEGGGETLPELVSKLKEEFSDLPSLVRKFEESLLEAGFLDAHAALYDRSYKVKKEELFRVKEDFPRITEIPQGLGNLRYSVVVGACMPFLENSDEYLKRLGEVH